MLTVAAHSGRREPRSSVKPSAPPKTARPVRAGAKTGAIEVLLMVMGAGLRAPGRAVSYGWRVVLTLAAAPPARLVAAVRGVRRRRW
jgi:hypothetical protein